MHPLVVVTANIQGWVTEGETAWQNRAELNGSVLQSLEPDLVGFQELHEHNLEAYRAMFASHKFSLGMDEGNGMRPNTMAWRRNRFAVLERHDFALHPSLTKLEPAWGATIPRAFSTAYLYDTQAKQGVLFVNTHLDDASKYARVEATKLIQEFILPWPAELPVVLTGDFNCSPWSPPSKYPPSRKPYDMWMEAGFTDSWRAVHGSNWPNTFHDYQGEDYSGDDFGSWHIDWILVKNLQVLSAEIVRTAEPPLYPSDHYPVRAFFDYLDES